MYELVERLAMYDVVDESVHRESGEAWANVDLLRRLELDELALELALTTCPSRRGVRVRAMKAVSVRVRVRAMKVVPARPRPRDARRRQRLRSSFKRASQLQAGCETIFRSSHVSG
jgi:hypothetical protein